MDYLNRGKAIRNHVVLLLGYGLVAIAIVASALILVYQANGFGLKDGAVIQNGLVFFSSQPNPADIYLNGVRNPKQTNTRLSLPADVYQVRLSREGYNDWRRTVNLLGGNVLHFDYPMLFPNKLITKKLAGLATPPGLLTQSPDRRWLLMAKPGGLTSFSLYDLKNPDKAPESLTLPEGLLSAASSSQSLKATEWADDNQHVVLRHDYDGKAEYLLLDRNDIGQSLNLNVALSANPATLTLNDKKYDRYYLYNADASLQTADLKTASVQPRLTGVLAYKSYSDDTVLYATAEDAPAGKVQIKLVSGTRITTLRALPAGDTYLLDLTRYDGKLYMVMSASATNRVYIYRDPVAQLAAQPDHAIVPTQVLHLDKPNYLSFSNNAQFVMAENGAQLAVYDIFNKQAYNYAGPSLDAPQEHAAWMDGNRLLYGSSGVLSVADYDNANRQRLMPIDARYPAAFAPDFAFVYAVAPAAGGQFELTQTALLTPADQ